MTARSLSGKPARSKTEIAGKPRRVLRISLLAAFVTGLTNCVAPATTPHASSLTMAQRMQAEPPGDYFIGRRYFKSNYRFWGYVRRPGRPWSSAVLVMLNENKKLAPDRAQLGPGTGTSYEGNAGFDNDYEYKITGYFSGDRIYELVSNRTYPEFVLTGYMLLSTHPPPIFRSQLRRRNASPFVIEKPE
ncbi:MAG: hypothetical protein H0X40_16780 [Chthoniobacterales bacterium]|nr:hypothetical protein [Chthoniobacterales bacterium]